MGALGVFNLIDKLNNVEDMNNIVSYFSMGARAILGRANRMIIHYTVKG